jgi:hypothetical protein
VLGAPTVFPVVPVRVAVAIAAPRNDHAAVAE